MKNVPQPKSVVRGKTRVHDKITANDFSGSLKMPILTFCKDFNL